MRTGGFGPKQSMNNATRIQQQLVALSMVSQVLGLDLEQSGFHCRGPTEPPQNTGQSQH